MNLNSYSLLIVSILQISLLCHFEVLQAIMVRRNERSTDNEKEIRVDLYGPSPYNLEDYCDNKIEKASFFIQSWKGAIFQVGDKFSSGNIPESRKIHKCKVTITTRKDFWLVAAIEHMKIRGNRDSSNKWQCSDYVQFKAKSRQNIVGKVLSVFNLDSFSAKKSEELCGNKNLDGENMDNIYDLSTDANTFSTASNELTFTFHQAKNERHLLNNSFKIVVTTFRHASEQVFAVECEGKQKCYGNDVYCIDKDFVCDGHVNCAFPGSATDEKLCKRAERPEIFNMTSVIIMTLMGMVVFGILVCIASTIFCRVKSRLDNGTARSTSSNPTFLAVSDSQHPASAPVFESEATLPPYETVILSDFSEDKNAADVGVNELPPKYESLFPDGGPCNTPPVKDNSSAQSPDR